MTPVVAVLVGVSGPRPFLFRGRRYDFGSPLAGVSGDLDWYELLLRRTVPAASLTLHRLSKPDTTTAQAIKDRLLDAKRNLPSGGLFVLVLCGHGFQATDDDGDEPDKLDEVFAAADGPITDDFFGGLWAGLDGDIVVIVDTCSADSLGIRGGRDVEPVKRIVATGPRRLSISASMAWEDAGEVPTRKGDRGVLSLALQSAWERIPGSRVSYLNWFLEAAQLVAVSRPQQHPRLRYLGQDEALLNRAPFS
ncbi:hypothetical protein [Actinokineospora sp. HUAS TT18]|uniref:hypothetical protein n=1 Tax=Actinokineospora sp. HUAS TT18 TaxID=3447451 RepID=UPI003F51B0F8